MNTRFLAVLGVFGLVACGGPGAQGGTGGGTAQPLAAIVKVKFAEKDAGSFSAEVSTADTVSKTGSTANGTITIDAQDGVVAIRVKEGTTVLQQKNCVATKALSAFFSHSTFGPDIRYSLDLDVQHGTCGLPDGGP